MRFLPRYVVETPYTTERLQNKLECVPYLILKLILTFGVLVRKLLGTSSLTEAVGLELLLDLLNSK
jgi:hypothetical protein